MSIRNEVEKALNISQNFDIKTKDIKVLNKKGTIIFVSSLIDSNVIVFLMLYLDKIKTLRDFKKKIYNSEIKEVEELEQIVDEIYQGGILLLLDNMSLIIDGKLFPLRSIEEPMTEKTIRGSRDGFNESINSNIALIRRRLKTGDLKIKSFVVSKMSKMSIAICYMESLVDKRLIKRIEKEIQSLNINSLIMTDRSLEELLFKQKYTPFPLVRYTERPDVACISMMHGKIIIIVDTSPSVIITPITFFDHTKHVEEFRQSPIVGSFTRFLRIMAIILSFFLVPLWMCMSEESASFNFALNDFKLSIPFQIIIVQIILEIVRIASIHTPTPLQTGISLISAIILGQVSLELGLFLPEVLLLSAIAQICGFATPSYEMSLALKLSSLGLIIITALFQKVGFILYTLFLFIYLIGLKVWSVPYLYPICPFDGQLTSSIFYRKSANNRTNL